ncbi:MAG TPA: Gfo/Idh/MocA family oxidoreductase [Trueperaceae bacterium]|nr:Gfo/Idh/MocA family oxidoreductase [Trueperaceae bacterium]
MPRPVTVALIGAGSRGADVYGRYIAQHPELGRVVAVAESRPAHRAGAAEQHGIAASHTFASWEDLLEGGRLADALIIATPDVLHVEPAKAALALGYRVLLEKPIAPTLAGVLELAAAARTSTGSLTVAHVLRHSAFFATIKRLLDQGRIGDLIHVQHTENVGHWHFAHSFVRGNWRREDQASPMILAKACHDLDLLRWLVGRPCTSVASYGGLRHFRLENAPAGSTQRCTGGCAVERECPYSALRIYLERFAGHDGWPNNVLTPEPNAESLLAALNDGPYGRCVYRCDNDVADNQVVALNFEGGVAASLTVSAFTEENTRTLHLMGSHGEIHGHMERGELIVDDFAADTREAVAVPTVGSGHSGADEALLIDFLERVGDEHAGAPPTGLEASIDSHLMAFAAEESRLSGASVLVGAPTRTFS